MRNTKKAAEQETAWSRGKKETMENKAISPAPHGLTQAILCLKSAVLNPLISSSDASVD